MTWHVQFTKSGGIAGIRRFPTRDGAIEEASRLFDAGCIVLGIGGGRARDSVDFAERFSTGQLPVIGVSNVTPLLPRPAGAEPMRRGAVVRRR